MAVAFATRSKEAMVQDSASGLDSNKCGGVPLRRPMQDPGRSLILSGGDRGLSVAALPLRNRLAHSPFHKCWLGTASKRDCDQ